MKLSAVKCIDFILPMISVRLFIVYTYTVAKDSNRSMYFTAIRQTTKRFKSLFFNLILAIFTLKTIIQLLCPSWQESMCQKTSFFTILFNEIA